MKDIVYKRSKVAQIISDAIVTCLVPTILTIFWYHDLIGIIAFKIGLAICFILFVLFPIIFKYSYKVQRGLLFLTFISYPANLDLSKPEKSGFYATRNFYIYHHDPKRNMKVRIGCWHVLPNHIAKKFQKQLNLNEQEISRINTTDKDIELDEKNAHGYTDILKQLDANFVVRDEESKKQFYEMALQYTSDPVVLYLHGNTASRGATHRMSLYEKLRARGYHIIAMDYRGYGDSSSLGPSARSVVLDSLNVYKYIIERTNSPVLLYGHSLGTGISTHLMTDLRELNVKPPIGVVLESPFNNIRDEVHEHPFARLFRNLPWFEFTFINPMYENSLAFHSDKMIAHIEQPIMILHAEDDAVVPFKLGYQLYRAALQSRPKNYAPIEFHRFAKKDGYGHKWICLAPEFGNLIDDFVNKYANNNSSDK